MPRVPQPRVAPQGLTVPQPRSPGPEAFGAGLAEGLQQVGGVLARFAKEERDKQDTIRLMDFQRQLDGLDHDLVVNGALQKRGKDALPVYAETLQAYDNATGELVSGLGSDTQKAAARALVERRRSQIGNTLEAHTAREMEVYSRETAAASEVSAANMAISYATDPTRREQAITEGLNGIRASGQVLGQSAEVIAGRVAKFRSAVHQGVIDRLLANDQDQAAADYLTEYRGEIEGGALAQVEAKVDNGTTLGRAFAEADRIFATAPDRKAAREMVAAITEPKVRQAAQAELNQRYAEADADAAKRENALFESYSDQMAQGTSLAAIKRQPGWIELDHNSRQALIAADEQRMRRLRGEAVVSDMTRLTEFLLKAPEEMAQVNPLKDLRPYLSNADYEQAVRQVAAARQFIATGKDEAGILGEGQSFNDRALSVARAAGIIPAEGGPAQWSESQKLAFDQTRNRLELALQSAAAAKGSKLNVKEKQEITDQFQIRLRLDRPVFRDTDVPGLTIPEDDIDRAYLPITAIDDAGQNAIISMIRTAGGDYSERKVERIGAVLALSRIGRLDADAARARLLEIAREPVE